MTITIPEVNGLTLECVIYYHDDGRDSLEEVTLVFDGDTWNPDDQNEFFEEYYYHMNREELASLIKAIGEHRDVWGIAHEEWAIDLCEPYEFIYTKNPVAS